LTSSSYDDTTSQKKEQDTPKLEKYQHLAQENRLTDGGRIVLDGEPFGHIVVRINFETLPGGTAFFLGLGSTGA